MPERIQWSRRKGWKKPEGAVYCGRPSKWGNPFHTHGDGVRMARGLAVAAFRAQLMEGRAFCANDHPKPHEVAARHLTTIEEIRAELRGRDLGCWCPLDEPCHVDVLLEIANA